MPALGFHSLFDFHACDAALLADREVVRAALLDAVREAGGTVVAEMFHQFEPHGVSGVVVIAESHITVHTWPERSFAAVDLFTCSPTLDHDRVEQSVARALKARQVMRQRYERGAAA